MEKKILLMIMFVLMFSVGVYGSVTYTKDSVISCNYGVCSGKFYSAPVFARDKNGNWVNASEVFRISTKGSNITFIYDGYYGYYNITFEVGVVYNGNYYSIEDIKEIYPDLNFNIDKKNLTYLWKYTINISNIPSLAIPNINYIALKYLEHNGFSIYDLKSSIKKWVIKDLVKIEFQDLLDNGYDVSLDLLNKMIYIGNLSDKFVNNSLLIDPTLSQAEGRSVIMDDASARGGSSTAYGTSTTLGLVVGDGSQTSDIWRFYVEANISKYNVVRVEDIGLNLYVYNVNSDGEYRDMYFCNDTDGFDETTLTGLNQDTQVTNCNDLVYSTNSNSFFVWEYVNFTTTYWKYNTSVFVLKMKMRYETGSNSIGYSSKEFTAYYYPPYLSMDFVNETPQIVSFSIAYPTTCSYGYGCDTVGCSSCTYAYFNTSKNTISAVEPNGQNSTVPFWSITNDGNVAINITFSLNETLPSGITLKIYNSSDYSSSSTLPFTPCVSLQPSSDCGVWSWVDFQNVSALRINRTIYINSTES